MQRRGHQSYQRDRFRPDTDGDNFELVEESMASYLNRKTALLMLWFPLGYVLLFSISLVRIIYDFAGTPPTILRALSRWFIFAQGISALSGEPPSKWARSTFAGHLSRTNVTSQACVDGHSLKAPVDTAAEEDGRYRDAMAADAGSGIRYGEGLTGCAVLVSRWFWPVADQRAVGICS